MADVCELCPREMHPGEAQVTFFDGRQVRVCENCHRQINPPAPVIGVPEVPPKRHLAFGAGVLTKAGGKMGGGWGNAAARRLKDLGE